MKKRLFMALTLLVLTFVFVGTTTQVTYACSPSPCPKK